jgi:hypothetical protein
MLSPHEPPDRRVGGGTRSSAGETGRPGHHGSATGGRLRIYLGIAPGAAALAAQRQLTESIGGTYHQLPDLDIPAALRPKTRIRSRVIRGSSGTDVHIITHSRITHRVPRQHADPPLGHQPLARSSAVAVIVLCPARQFRLAGMVKPRPFGTKDLDFPNGPGCLPHLLPRAPRLNSSMAARRAQAGTASRGSEWTLAVMIAAREREIVEVSSAASARTEKLGVFP